MTTSLSSSLDVVSLHSSTRWASDSLSDEDEIVWSLSSSAVLSISPPICSPLSETAEFVLVPRVHTSSAAAALSASPSADTIANQMAALSLAPALQARSSANPAAAAPSTVPTRAVVKTKKSKRPHVATATTARAGPSVGQQQQRPQQQARTPPTEPRNTSLPKKKGANKPSAPANGTPSSSPSSVKKSRAKSSAKRGGSTTHGVAPASTGLRSRADSVSETSEVSSLSSSSTAAYEEAQKYMTSYLAHPPPPGNNGSALLMLQALILELGCLPSVAKGKFSIPQLPATLRQAKLLLKSHAFINVRDYLAVREQGQAALQGVMHPNRKSLVKEVRKGKRRMPVGEVKKAGLNVLLVNTRC